MDYRSKIILKFPNLYQDSFKDKYFYYNKEGNGNIVVVEKELYNFLKKLNHNMTLNEICLKNNYKLKEINPLINTLLKKEILYVKDEFQKIDKKKKVKQLSCWLHITNSCNLQCKYCYIHKNPGEMDIKLFKKNIKQMVDYCKLNKIKKINLKFAGGEPTLRIKFIKEIIEYCLNQFKHIEFSFSMITNGTLINMDIINLIKKYNIGVGVSLDGLKKVNDINRFDNLGKGSFDRVIKNLDIIKKHNIKPMILITLTINNIKKLPQFTEYLVKNNYNFRFSLERNYDTGIPNILKKQKLIIKKINQCIKFMQKTLCEGNANFNFQFGDVYFNGPKNKVCAAGTTFYALGQDGNIGMCGMGLSTPVLNINDIKSNILEEYRKKTNELAEFNINNIKQCKKCIWKSSCANACPLQTYSTYKTYNHVSPYCKIYKKCLPEYIKLKAMFIYYNSNIIERRK